MAQFIQLHDSIVNLELVTEVRRDEVRRGERMVTVVRLLFGHPDRVTELYGEDAEKLLWAIHHYADSDA
ncbi:MAG TPA: hypothetical protein VFI42_20250 [Thermomicrobiaceae bacterium]|nr:hypothetical protein [Thermomicrobiaceae bacterium]